MKDKTENNLTISSIVADHMAAGENVEAVRISGEGTRAQSALSVLENNAAVEKVSKTIEPD